MKTVLVAFVFNLLAACSTTPTTESQMIAADARREHRGWKAWCLRNHGVVFEDDLTGRRCFRSEDLRNSIIVRRHGFTQE